MDSWGRTKQEIGLEGIVGDVQNKKHWLVRDSWGYSNKIYSIASDRWGVDKTRNICLLGKVRGFQYKKCWLARDSWGCTKQETLAC
jgi:hypothetical protein